ncbi:MAG TPA: immunoglobulin domain-containing protein [Verrucomicrobiae bacterium]
MNLPGRQFLPTLVPRWLLLGLLGVSAIACAAGGAANKIPSAAGDAPVITDHPIGRNAMNGAHVALAVLAQGTAPLAYQWFRNGLPLANDARVTGAQGAVLNIDPARTNDIGAYIVVITNLSGSATSAPVSVNVSFINKILTVVSGGLRIRLPGQVGDVYRIETSPNASGGPWHTNGYATNRTGEAVYNFRFSSTTDGFIEAVYDHMLPIFSAPNPERLDSSIRIYGKLNQIWRLQKSSNLLQWAEHSVITNSTGTARVFDDVDVQRFYRVIPP